MKTYTCSHCGLAHQPRHPEHDAAVKRLMAEAETAGLAAEDLDELIHDLASGIAADVNNSGLPDQIGYLVAELGPADAALQFKQWIKSRKTLERRRLTMADNFLEFSEVLPSLTGAEEAWLKEQLQPIRVFGRKEYAEDESPGEEYAGTDPDWEGPRFLRDKGDCDPKWDGLGFEYQFCTDEADGRGRSCWGRHLWLYTEEWGNPANVAWLMRKVLRKFRPSQCWSLTYAVTCSKPRVGEFGGGAVFVTAKRLVYLNAENWTADCVASWKRKTRQKTRRREKP
jgi:hypothetical protein